MRLSHRGRVSHQAPPTALQSFFGRCFLVSVSLPSCRSRWRQSSQQQQSQPWTWDRNEEMRNGVMFRTLKMQMPCLSVAVTISLIEWHVKKKVEKGQEWELDQGETKSERGRIPERRRGGRKYYGTLGRKPLIPLGVQSFLLQGQWRSVKGEVIMSYHLLELHRALPPAVLSERSSFLNCFLNRTNLNRIIFTPPPPTTAGTHSLILAGALRFLMLHDKRGQQAGVGRQLESSEGNTKHTKRDTKTSQFTGLTAF